jgi:hypothetical protein
MLVGIITSRRIIGVPALAGADAETLVRTVGPAIQQLLAVRSPMAIRTPKAVSVASPDERAWS